MADRSKITSWLTDMDGVLVHEGHVLPGAAELISKWQSAGTPFLVLTNNSIYTPRDLSARLRAGGLDVPEERIWTSALATASFLHSQNPNGSSYVIGESGLTQALHDVGYTQTEINPDYVVLGETRNFNFENLTKAVRLINGGARFMPPTQTQPDLLPKVCCQQPDLWLHFLLRQPVSTLTSSENQTR
jgi:NagD protein